MPSARSPTGAAKPKLKTRAAIGSPPEKERKVTPPSSSRKRSSRGKALILRSKDSSDQAATDAVGTTSPGVESGAEGKAASGPRRADPVTAAREDTVVTPTLTAESAPAGKMAEAAHTPPGEVAGTAHAGQAQAAPSVGKRAKANWALAAAKMLQEPAPSSDPAPPSLLPAKGKSPVSLAQAAAAAVAADKRAALAKLAAAKEKEREDELAKSAPLPLSETSLRTMMKELEKDATACEARGAKVPVVFERSIGLACRRVGDEQALLALLRSWDRDNQGLRVSNTAMRTRRRPSTDDGQRAPAH